MNYQETVSFLFSTLPYFTRDGKSAYKKDLGNITALCQLLDNPQNRFQSLHIAGTNGKGSVCNMLASVLQTHGLKTGLYTSPHLKDFRERIRINGIPVTEEFVVSFTERLKPALEEIKPSFFEITVAMAFEWFAINKVDMAVIETGLGGRLDSTNIITPVLSVITNIGMDHTDLLGDTLQAIAGEKAGIIKPGVPVVIGETHPDTQPVFIEKARSCNADIVFADSNPNWYNTYLELDLPGDYQQKNAVTVMQCTGVLNKLGYKLEPFCIADALLHVKERTGFRGRWDILAQKPLTVADTGHNPHGIEQVVAEIRKQSYRRLHMVIGMMRDKDRQAVLKLLPKEAVYYFCRPDLPRAMDDTELKKEAESAGLRGGAYGSVHSALQAAREAAGHDDMIFIGGSTFVVAEAI